MHDINQNNIVKRSTHIVERNVSQEAGAEHNHLAPLRQLFHRTADRSAASRFVRRPFTTATSPARPDADALVDKAETAVTP